jgi:hypothetical protein
MFLAGKPGEKPVLQEPGRYSARDKVTGRPLCAVQRSRAPWQPSLPTHAPPTQPAAAPVPRAHTSAGLAFCCSAPVLPPPPVCL